MLVKSAEVRTKDINSLLGLLDHPAMTTATKQNIEQEIRCIRAGVKGEEEAAYELNFNFKSNPNWAVIHDLRIEHDEWSAQIDHILIDRFLDMWVLETKHFSEGIAINEHGECSAFFGGKAIGIPSPFEQNRRHCNLLKLVFKRGEVELPRRFGISIKPNIKSFVLVSKNARITRPKASIDAVSSILKVDQLFARVNTDYDSDNNPLRVARIVSSETLEQFAKALAALHAPVAFDWHAKFGLSKDIVSQHQSERESDGKQRCFSCGVSVSEKVAKYCLYNEVKYSRNVYCMDCQGTMQAKR